MEKMSDTVYEFLIESLRILSESGHQNAVFGYILDDETIEKLKQDNYSVIVEKGKTYIYWKS